MCKLIPLKVLDIAGNGSIQKLPRSLEDLTNVVRLDLSRCDLKEFPQVLCKLKSLQNLNLSKNPIKELSSFIFEIKILHKLDISYTLITCLPRAIERCEHLEELNISGTLINEFPTVIFKMKSLLEVVAQDISFQILDEDFIQLWAQKPDIFTEGRFQKMVKLQQPIRFVKPPNEIVQYGAEACMKYYRALRADNAVSCSMLNVTVMGEKGLWKI